MIPTTNHRHIASEKSDECQKMVLDYAANHRALHCLSRDVTVRIANIQTPISPYQAQRSR
jgi:hypothetical protein